MKRNIVFALLASAFLASAAIASSSNTNCRHGSGAGRFANTNPKISVKASSDVPAGKAYKGKK